MIAQAWQDHPELSMRRLCALLGVGRSWYYARVGMPTQAERDVALRDAIERLVLELPGYGYRRVTKTLQRDGWTVNHKRVLRVMRQEALLCQLKRRFVVTTDSGHGLQTYSNLAAGFAPTGPDQTYVACQVARRLRAVSQNCGWHAIAASAPGSASTWRSAPGPAVAPPARRLGPPTLPPGAQTRRGIGSGVAGVQHRPCFSSLLPSPLRCE